MTFFDFDKAIAATPGAVHEAMQKVWPDRYTPELADQIAADIAACLNQLRPEFGQIEVTA